MKDLYRLGAAVFAMSLACVAIELVMIRVFDFVFTRNLSFLIISAALFAFGLAGVFVSLGGTRGGDAARNAALRNAAVAFGVSALALRPGLNFLAVSPAELASRPVMGVLSIACAGLLLSAPFFTTGLFLARVFSAHSQAIGPLYAVDLTGAALGALSVLPLLPALGPGGISAVASALAFVAAACVSPSGTIRRLIMTLAAAALAVAFVPRSAADFRVLLPKGDGLAERLRAAQRRDTVEYSVWDPISRIDVLPGGRMKEVAYDGGAQTTTLFEFDGDFRRLRTSLAGSVYRHFWNRGVLAAHYLREGRGSRVLVIGAGGGQEVKAAVLFGASEVDAVEMVGAVVDLATSRYAGYLGQPYAMPGVRVLKGEGRTYLRSTAKLYDIIQIYSNHTTSSLASGSGAMDVSYLLTAEAFQEYFLHLRPGGVLQINHPLYPRIVTTAAAGWKANKREEFRRHVLVYQRDPSRSGDMKPTVLVKSDPWTRDEVARMDLFFSADLGENVSWIKTEDPLHPGAGRLAESFFQAPIPDSLAALVPYRIEPPTDDRPFFKFARKTMEPLTVDPTRFTDRAVVEFVETGRLAGLLRDLFHLFALGGAALFVALPAALIPLLASRLGRAGWRGRGSAILYFSLLGIAFVVIELVLIQKCMKLIGYPLHAYSTVMAGLLVSAGVGSVASRRIPVGRAAKLVFPAIAVVGACSLLAFPRVAGAAMEWRTAGRVAAAGILVCPLGVLMGMPFPLGVRALERAGPPAIAWAWGMNGLATVLGGLASVVSCVFWGFDVTIAVALGLYALAGPVLLRMRTTEV